MRSKYEDAKLECNSREIELMIKQRIQRQYFEKVIFLQFDAALIEFFSLFNKLSDQYFSILPSHTQKNTIQYDITVGLFSIILILFAYLFELYNFNSMSQVIADMDLALGIRAPPCILSQTLQRGIFYNKSFLSYSDNEIKVLTRKQLCGTFQLITNITIQKMELSLQSTLLKNGEFFIINSSEVKKNLYRSFIKTTFQPTLKILINQQGRLAFKMHTFLATQVQFKHKKEADKIKTFIQSTYIQMMEVFSNVFQKIRLVIQPISEKKMYENEDRVEKLDIIKTTCSFMFVKPSFIYTSASRKKVNKLTQNYRLEDELEPTKIYDMKIQSHKIPQKQKFQLFVELWGDSLNLQKVEDTGLYKNTSLVQIKHKIKSNVKIPEPKFFKSLQPQQVLSTIHLYNIDKTHWNKIYEGGFGAVFKGNVSFFFINENSKEKKFLHQKPIQKPLVIKTDKSNGKKLSRIEVQKTILKSIKKKRSRFLPKFYESDQKIGNFSNYILMEYFPERSLLHWFHIYGQFMSLSSKLMILLFVCYGLYFLHQNNIVHRDLKTSNILIESKMVTKIIDFGQSYHLSLQQLLIKNRAKDRKPGFTLPYCPPQTFSKSNASVQSLKSTTYDIFSLGFIIFEIIFGRNLLGGVSQIELKKLYLKQTIKLESQIEQHLEQEEQMIEKPSKPKKSIINSGNQTSIQLEDISDDKNSNSSEEDLSRYRSQIKERLYLTEQQISYYGPSELLSPMLNIVQRCIDPKKQNRPQLQWIINIIRQVYGSITQFYNI